MSQPIIEVLLCTHNGERYILEQLESLSAQSVLPATIYIFDWGSTDCTRRIVEEFRASSATKLNLRIFFQSISPGPSQSFQLAMKTLRRLDNQFDYLCLCDQDDVWHPNKIEKFTTAIQRAAETPAILFSDARLVTSDGSQLQDSVYGPNSVFLHPYRLNATSLLLNNPVIGMSMCVSREMVNKFLENSGVQWVMHDWGLVLVAALEGKSIQYIDEALVDYRQHSTNQMGFSGTRSISRRFWNARDHIANVRTQIQQLHSRYTDDPKNTVACSIFPSTRGQAARAAINSSLIKKFYAMIFALLLLAFW